LLKAVESLSHEELPGFLTMWHEDLHGELHTNAHGHLRSKKQSLAKAVPDSFPAINVLLSYTDPITSTTDTSAQRTHTLPRWEHEPDLGKLAHLCELHFEWGLKDTIIKHFRTIIWPSIILHTLQRSAMEAATDYCGMSGEREGEPPHDVFGTLLKLLTQNFSSMGFRPQGTEGGGDDSLQELLVKIHSSRTHACTNLILEYRLEVVPVQLVHFASAGVQELRKPTDTMYDVLPSESEDECGRDLDVRNTGRRKIHGTGSPQESDSHLLMWMPACMVYPALPELVKQYKAGLEVKHTKSKHERRAPPATMNTKSSSSKRKAVKLLVPPAKEAHMSGGQIPHSQGTTIEASIISISSDSDDDDNGLALAHTLVPATGREVIDLT
jgi:Holliday junction resolvase YEN1